MQITKWGETKNYSQQTYRKKKRIHPNNNQKK